MPTAVVWAEGPLSLVVYCPPPGPAALASCTFGLAKVGKHLQQTGEAKAVLEVWLQLLFPLQKS